MARLLTGAEIFKYLNNVYIYRPVVGTHGSTTLSGALTAGVSLIPMTAITNFTDQDPIVVKGINGWELFEISGTVNASMPVKRKVVIAQPATAGQVVEEFVRADLGQIAEGGVTFGGTLTLTAIMSATSRVAIAYFASPAELTWSIPVLGFNPENVQVAFGAPESVTGVGTDVDPIVGQVNRLNVGTLVHHIYRCVGVREDGLNVEVDFLDATVEVNTSVTIGSASPGGITIQGKCTGFMVRYYT
jgi:hypothetical protein